MKDSNLQEAIGFTSHTGIPAPFFVSADVNALWDSADSDVVAPYKPNPPRGEDAPPGERAFELIRYHADGSENADFILNKERYRDASILIVGKNFATGSNRRVAVPRLMGYGYRVILAKSTSYSIYQWGIRNGMLVAILPEEVIDRLVDWVVSHPSAEMTVDVDKQVVLVPGWQPISFPFEPRTRRKWAMNWTELDEILEHTEAAKRFLIESRRNEPWAFEEVER